MEQEAVPGDSGMLYEEEWDKREIAYVSPPWEIWEKEMTASDMIEGYTGKAAVLPEGSLGQEPGNDFGFRTVQKRNDADDLPLPE